ncbi:aspartyl-tRNA synthetase, archaeal type [Halovivax ruber XH-70]|uniref:Aspartate--tRNA(Asp/Asn) ligase n=1 Tax=Halovivax ruber (strain DSM 18193 / JCM 13892 / XH-70) TaxID=797302 RepID=L0I9M5_HALRX|nr:aspartate--tRNA(Asn) ligase [Halovivax ruber]AGB14667.1 aspartyl-tRNA synthetase, archaeal type [Halovivax ruber XH-70]
MQDRTYIDDCEPTESTTTIAGHVHEIRDLGGIQFVLIRDRTGRCQVVVKDDEHPALTDRVDDLGREDVVRVTGDLVVAEQAPGGVELFPDELVVLDAAATDLPLEIAKAVDADRSTRLDHRAIDVRSPETRAIFSLRSKVIVSLRSWFRDAAYEEVETPTITAAGAEGGAELFPVVYYDREAVLSQSPQLYKQVLVAAGFDRLFEFGTAFRAEAFATSRHVSEISMLDVELGYIEDHHDVMDVQEASLRHALDELRTRADRELTRLDVDLTVPTDPFPRITFEEARELLATEYDHEPEDPTDLDTRGERLLGEYFAERGQPAVFVVGYPEEKFYYRQDVPDDEIASRKFDLLYRGLELSSGGQREHDVDRLRERMVERGLELADFEFYLEGLSYGTPPHGGFGLGIDRLVQQIADLDHVSEAILFPRDPGRLAP